MGQTTPFPYDPAVSTTAEAQDQHVESLREMLELPAEATFCGFLIHRDDEYLHETNDSLGQTTRAYVPGPQLAYRFRSYDEARNLVRSDRGEDVAVLFALEGDLIVAGLVGASESDGETLH